MLLQQQTADSILQNWTTHRDEWQLTNPDSQSDTQEAIQSERAKGKPLIQPS